MQRPHQLRLSMPKRRRLLPGLLFMPLLLLPTATLASQAAAPPMDLTGHGIAHIALGLFILAYLLVMGEEITGMRKSKPVLLAAGIIWGLIGFVYADMDQAAVAEEAVRQVLLDYAELMLFLLVAMTYINAMHERGLLNALRGWLVSRGFGYRSLFWCTGLLAFFISPVADNLTTALLMCAVVLAVDAENRRFVSLSCTGIVIAANAGGAFSPFGDLTTLMVWQQGVLEFHTFFKLFLPALVNYLVPAAVMYFFVPAGRPRSTEGEICLRRGARRIMLLFMLTILSTVLMHRYLSMPPVIGMLTGLGYLQLFGYYCRKTMPRWLEERRNHLSPLGNDADLLELASPFDVFNTIQRAEWDTLLFFYGVIMCVGGLGFLGYLHALSAYMYGGWDVTYANIAVGLISAVIDNIPVMFAVLNMNPPMPEGQWLLVTMTAGVGGSLLSIGSAAGVALMGQARGSYTFFSHLKWTPVIALGYAAGIFLHLWLNSGLFRGI